MKKYLILTTKSGSDYLVDPKGNIIVRISSKGKYQDFEEIGISTYCVNPHNKQKRFKKPHKLSIGDCLTIRIQAHKGIKTDFKPFLKTQPIVSITSLDSEMQARKYLQRIAGLYVLENGDEYLVRKDGRVLTINKAEPEKNTWVNGFQDPDGKIKDYKDPLKIPLEHRILLAEDRKFIEDCPDYPNIVTDPIFNSEILTFIKVVEYLMVQQ